MLQTVRGLERWPHLQWRHGTGVLGYSPIIKLTRGPKRHRWIPAPNPTSLRTMNPAPRLTSRSSAVAHVTYKHVSAWPLRPKAQTKIPGSPAQHRIPAARLLLPDKGHRAPVHSRHRAGAAAAPAQIIAGTTKAATGLSAVDQSCSWRRSMTQKT